MEKQYHIKLGGQLIAVTEEVYRAYMQPKWREAKRADVCSENEYSLDAMYEDSRFELPDTGASLDELTANKLMLDELYAALDELSDDERLLINELFFNEKTERELSKELYIPQKTINNRKSAILKKLKIFFK